MSISSPLKLFYSPTSCGAASYLLAHHAGLDFLPEEVDVQGHKTLKGEDMFAINSKGNVPTLLLPNGLQLNENVSVLLYLADQARSKGKVMDLAPAEGSFDRYLFINLLSYLATELHKGCYYRLFSAGMMERHSLKKGVEKQLKLLNEQLTSQRHSFIFNNNFTAADAYLYVMLTWNQHFDIGLDEYPALKEYFERVKGLTFVQEAHQKMNQLHEMNQQARK